MNKKNLIKILNAEPAQYSREARGILQSIGELHESILTRRELLDCLKDFDILIVRLGFQVDQEVINAGPRLKVIVTATTGLDHIDIAYTRSRGIKVLSLEGETRFLNSIPATAEHTWALLLALVRRIPWDFRSVLNGEWDRDAFRGHDLKDKHLGIVGLGRIGKKVARYALAFGMKVRVYDPYKRGTVSSQVTQFGSLGKLLTSSDIVSLHVPLNSRTEGLIGEKEFDLMKPGTLLVNTSRGPVIDEHALLRA
jgi:D-3-phosphoglycerate dehydrogenase